MARGVAAGRTHKRGAYTTATSAPHPSPQWPWGNDNSPFPGMTTPISRLKGSSKAPEVDFGDKLEVKNRYLVFIIIYIIYIFFIILKDSNHGQSNANSQLKPNATPRPRPRCVRPGCAYVCCIRTPHMLYHHGHPTLPELPCQLSSNNSAATLIIALQMD